MKGYKPFIIIFFTLLVLYVVMELNKPTPVDWTVTISKKDKKPYGAYILYDRLKDVFPSARVLMVRTPVYDQINNFQKNNTAYFLLGDKAGISSADLQEMKKYVHAGNYAFLSYNDFGASLLDSFRLKVKSTFSIEINDTVVYNFSNPGLKVERGYSFMKPVVDNYFSSFDTVNSVILGANGSKQVNFLKIPFGNGAFFFHANPVCFSNYFMLHQGNASYTSKSLSYIPQQVDHLYWDEFYKSGWGGVNNPFRFLLSNEYLAWAFRLALIALVIYILFQSRRTQRIIPVIEPLRNTTLDFINTVAGLYFNARDNKGMAERKINFWREFVRHRFNISVHTMNEDFAEQLSRKSGLNMNEINELIGLMSQTEAKPYTDKMLLVLNNKIDNFYKQL